MFSVSRVFSLLKKVRFSGGAAPVPTAFPWFSRLYGGDWDGQDGPAARATPLVDDELEDARTMAGRAGESDGTKGVEYPNSVHKSRWHTNPPFEIRMATIFYRAPEPEWHPNHLMSVPPFVVGHVEAAVACWREPSGLTLLMNCVKN